MKTQLLNILIVLTPIMGMAQSWNVVPGSMLTSPDLSTLVGNYTSSGKTSDDLSRLWTTHKGKNIVLEFDGSKWELLGDTVNPSIVQGEEGYFRAMSGDGKVLAFGNQSTEGPNNTFGAGHVEVMEFINGSWVRKGSIIFGAGQLYQYGSEVALSKDGNIIALGSIYNDTYSSGGTVWIFEFDGSDWNPLGTSISGDSDYGQFGSGLALSDDGNTILIGANRGRALINNSPLEGYAKVFEFDGSDWIQKGQTLFGASSSSFFGGYCDISGDGNTIAISEVGYPAAQMHVRGSQGRIGVFQYSGSWNQIGDYFEGTPGSRDNVGAVFDLSNDGQYFGYSNRLEGALIPNKGELYIYKRDNNDWTPVGSVLSGIVEDEYYGTIVRLSLDGKRILTSRKIPTETFLMEFGNGFTSTDEDQLQSDIKCFPNPVENTLFVDLADEEAYQSFSVYDLQGKLIKEVQAPQSQLSISTSNWPSGVYFVQLTSSNGISYHKKIIKQ